MFPYSDHPPEKRKLFPFVMLGIILINVLVFIFELNMGSQLDQFVHAYGVVPYDYTHGQVIPPGPQLPIFFTLFTSMFMHAGWLHLLGNMLFLWVFGDNVEDQFGHLPFLLFYLLCGLAASALHILFNANSPYPSIGASGAIAGVLAAYVIMFPRAPVNALILFLPLRVPAIVLIGVWIALQVFSAIASLTITTAENSGVAFWAHVGGFGAGVLMTLLLKGLGATRDQRASTRF